RDWSSDVCSSDLLGVGLVVVGPGDHALLDPGADTAWIDPGVGREVVDGIDRGFRHERCLHHTPSSCYTTPQVAIMLLVVHSGGDTIHEQRAMALPLLRAVPIFPPGSFLQPTTPAFP